MQILYQNNITGAVHNITTLTSAAKWKTQRVGAPAQLDLTVVSDAAVTYTEGGIITVTEGSAGVFYGYIFKLSYSDKETVSITAYDQMRYLKNKDTYVFKGKRADEILAQIAADFQIKLGALENTGYVIPQMVEDGQTLFDIVLKALDHTLINTGRMFYLWDDFGSLRISDVAKSIIALVVGDNSLATGYTYSSEIDSDTANRIKLVYDNKTTGKRDLYVVQDGVKIARWGILQHYAKVGEGLNPAQIEAQADQLLLIKGRPKKAFDVSGLSDLSIRAGRAIKVEISDIKINGWYIVEEADHDLLKETMTLKLAVV